MIFLKAIRIYLKFFLALPSAHRQRFLWSTLTIVAFSFHCAIWSAVWWTLHNEQGRLRLKCVLWLRSQILASSPSSFKLIFNLPALGTNLHIVDALTLIPRVIKFILYQLGNLVWSQTSRFFLRNETLGGSLERNRHIRHWQQSSNLLHSTIPFIKKVCSFSFLCALPPPEDPEPRESKSRR